MNNTSLLYAVGLVVEVWLALALFVTWRELKDSGARWPLLMGAAFSVNAVRMYLLASGHGNVPLDQPAWYVNTALGQLAVWLATAALIDLTAVPRSVARPAMATAIVVGSVIIVGTLGRWITRGQSLDLAAGYFILWMALSLYASWRESGSGHGFVVVALAAFPLGGIALHAGWMPASLLPANELAPIAAVGMSALVTGLVRAHRHARHESALASRALADRELAEARLRAANETLELRVTQRTRELHETIDGLESFNRIVSHDLRGPLGGIAGVAQLAREQVACGRPDEAQRMLAAIEHQADASIRMVGALLALAKASDARPQRQPIDTVGLVNDVLASLRALPQPAAAGRPPQVVIGPLPLLEADPDLLRQVFVNLIGNAIKFSARSPDPRVEIGATDTVHGPVFHVLDNGVGFGGMDAQRLFRPFERLHGAAYEGVGVGLTIVRRIVEHHGGRIWAEGAPGRGACFRFTLGDGSGE